MWLALFATAPRKKRNAAIRWGARVGLAACACLVYVALNLTNCDFSGARARMARLHVAQLDSALTEFYEIHRAYPDTVAGLAALTEAGLIKKVPLDPWGHPYEYSMHGSHYVLRTLGADHRLGGTGDAADVDRFVVLEDSPAAKAGSFQGA